MQGRSYATTTDQSVEKEGQSRFITLSVDKSRVLGTTTHRLLSSSQFVQAVPPLLTKSHRTLRARQSVHAILDRLFTDRSIICVSCPASIIMLFIHTVSEDNIVVSLLKARKLYKAPK